MSVFFWRPHTKAPEEIGPMPALIATSDPQDHADAQPFLLGIYFWRNGFWHRETDDAAPLTEPFWWVPEHELLKGLKP